MILSYYDKDSCVDEGFFVVFWGVWATPQNCFIIQKGSRGGLLNREQLQELLWCYLQENRLTCSFYKQCYTSKQLNEIRQRLNDAYFFRNLWDGCPYHPRCLKIYLFYFRDTTNFRVEIYPTKKENEWFFVSFLFDFERDDLGEKRVMLNLTVISSLYLFFSGHL